MMDLLKLLRLSMREGSEHVLSREKKKKDESAAKPNAPPLPSASTHMRGAPSSPSLVSTGAPSTVQSANNLSVSVPRSVSAERDSSLVVCVQTPTGEKTWFKLNRFATAGKLMEAACNRSGYPSGAVRFLFDGSRLEDNRTLADYRMESGDVIDVLLEMRGA